MTETQTAAPIDPQIAPPGDVHEDRMMPAIIYGLSLLGLTNGVTILIGLVIAYAHLGAASPKMRSHYVFQIRTVWIALVWRLIALALILVGAVLAIVLIGFPILHLGMGILGLGGVWYLIRSLAGAVYLAQDKAYPNPKSWLI